MTKGEIREFLKRKDLKLSTAMLIVWLVALAYMNENWTMLYIMIVVLLAGFLFYMDYRDVYKK